MIEECVPTLDAESSRAASERAASRLESFDHIPENPAFRRDWDDLVQAMDSPEIFYTWEWAEAVVRAFGNALHPLILGVYNGEALIGIAALNVEEDGYVSFLNAITADYCDFVSAPAFRHEFLQMVMEELSRRKVAGLRLANLPADSPTVDEIRAAAHASGFSLFSRPAYWCAQVILDTQETRNAAAQSARRRLKKLAAAGLGLGELSVAHSQSWSEFLAEFPRFVEAHVARFKGTNQVSNLASPERQMFLTELAKLLCGKGWLMLSLLRANGRTVAWNYGFMFAGKWFYYQPTFDSQAQRLSPGSYLLSTIIQAASQNEEISIVDLGLGGEDYKSRYAQGGRQTLQITVEASKAKLAWRVFRHHAVELVKRSPRLERIARACRDRLRPANLDSVA